MLHPTFSHISPFVLVLADKADDLFFRGADILVVSDGELPNPPLDPETSRRLRNLQQKQGLQARAPLSLSLSLSLSARICHTDLNLSRLVSSFVPPFPYVTPETCYHVVYVTHARVWSLRCTVSSWARRGRRHST